MRLQRTYEEFKGFGESAECSRGKIGVDQQGDLTLPP